MRKKFLFLLLILGLSLSHNLINPAVVNASAESRLASAAARYIRFCIRTPKPASWCPWRKK